MMPRNQLIFDKSNSIRSRTEERKNHSHIVHVILLHSNSVGALEQVFIVSHSYQIFFGLLISDLYLDYGLGDHMITRFVYGLD